MQIEGCRVEIHDEVDHHLLLGRLRLGDHHREGDERVVGDALGAILAEQEPVSL